MIVSRLSAVHLKSSVLTYRKPLHLNRLLDKRFFHKHSNLLEFTPLRNINIRRVSVRQFSATPGSSFGEESSFIRFVSENSLVYNIQDALVKLHDFTGLSWWATIIVATFTVRTVLILPLTIHQHYTAAKLEQVNKMMDTTVKADVTKLVNDLSIRNNWSSKRMSQEYKAMIRERRREKIIEYNCSPAQTAVVALIQAPVWISLSSAIRNLVYMLPSQDVNAQLIFIQMKVSNFLWVSNLTMPDTYTIPICLAIFNLSLFQVNFMAIKEQKGFRKIILNLLRCFSLYIAYVSSTVPAAISLYWLTSSFYGLCQNIILTNPRIRKSLGIPHTESTRRNPLVHSYKKIKNFTKFFKY